MICRPIVHIDMGESSMFFFFSFSTDSRTEVLAINFCMYVSSISNVSGNSV